MAQALPRFCPRCGTATRANMRVCPTCGLPAEAMFSRARGVGEEGTHTVEQAEGLDIEDFSTQIEQLPFVSPTAARGSEAPLSVRHQDDDGEELSAHSGQQAFAAPHTSGGQPASARSWGQGDDIEDMPTQAVQPPFVPPLTPRASEPAPRYWSQESDVEDMPTQAVQPSFSPPNAPRGREADQHPWPQSAVAKDLPTQIGQQPLAAPRYENWQHMPDSRTQAAEASTRSEAQAFPPPAPWNQTSAPSAWSPPPAPVAPPEPVQPVTPPRRRGRRVVLVVLLLLLLALGGGGYLAYTLRGGHLLQATQSTIKTTKLNIQVNYAGIDITLINVQQAQNFLNDPNSASNGMLRLNLQEQNNTTTSISWNYSQIARLLPQGGKAIAPVYVKSATSIAPNVTTTSLIDFPIANGGDLSRLLFELGGSQEAQLQIPLTGQAQIDKYKPQTSQQNGTMLYFGLNWTLTSATVSLSIPGQQAPSGQEFLTLTLEVDNTLSQEAITGSPFDYLRVQAGSQTVSPIATTLPVSFATGEMGKTGTATFLIPQNSHTCTLILLSQDPGTSGQATTAFQVG